MSIKLMSAVFESKTLGPTERLIMLVLADHADEDGKCYPSVARIRDRTGLSERAVQSNIKKLIDQGYLTVSFGGGKGNSNLYFVSANPAADAPKIVKEAQPNPAGNAPRSKCTPAVDAPQTPQQVRLNPAVDAPEPSRTTIEPSVADAQARADAPPKAETDRERLLAAAGADPVSGMIGPNGTQLGKLSDMAEAAKWSTELGLTVEEQCGLIAEKMERERGRNPAFIPRSLAFFTGVMTDYAARKASPLSAPSSFSKPADKASKLDRWRKIAGAGNG